MLAYAVIYQIRVQVFKIGKTYELRNLRIIAHIAFFIRIFLTPLLCGHTEKRNVQNVGFACVNERRLFFRNFKRNDNVVFDSVGMYAIIYFCKFSLNRPPDLLLFVGF